MNRLVFALCLAVPASASAYSFGINGAACAYDTLAEAISNASTTSTDTIHVKPGLYPVASEVVVDRDVVIRASGSDCTAVAGTYAAFRSTTPGQRVMRILPDTTVDLRRLMLRDGTAADGGNLHLMEGAEVTLKGSRLTLGDAVRGGGVYAEDATVNLIGRSQISQNHAGAGAGIYLHHSTLTVDDSDIWDNHADTNGGGIAGNRAIVVVQLGSHIGAQGDSNTATNGAGIHLVNESDLTVFRGAFVEHNIATGIGGGVHINRGFADIRARVRNNQAENGGGLYVKNTVTVALSNSRFTGNTASEDGGALYADSTSLEVRQIQPWVGNPTGAPVCSRGPYNACAIFDSNVASGNGGAIYIKGWVTYAVLSRVHAYDNQAIDGAFLYQEEGNFFLASNLLVGNTATQGATLTVVEGDAGFDFVRNNTIADNTGWGFRELPTPSFLLGGGPTFDNNIVWGQTDGSFLGSPSFDSTACNNVYNGGLSGLLDVSQDPQFATDYRLTSNSIDVCNTPYNADALDGVLRPVNSNNEVDRGAFEQGVTGP